MTFAAGHCATLPYSHTAVQSYKQIQIPTCPPARFSTQWVSLSLLQTCCKALFVFLLFPAICCRRTLCTAPLRSDSSFSISPPSVLPFSWHPEKYEYFLAACGDGGEFEKFQHLYVTLRILKAFVTWIICKQRKILVISIEEPSRALSRWIFIIFRVNPRSRSSQWPLNPGAARSSFLRVKLFIYSSFASWHSKL